MCTFRFTYVVWRRGFAPKNTLDLVICTRDRIYPGCLIYGYARSLLPKLHSRDLLVLWGLKEALVPAAANNAHP